MHAPLGGFHLTGPVFEPIIEPTIEAMKEIGPDYVVLMHCSRWKAINQFAEEMPGQFPRNSVGTTYVFQQRVRIRKALICLLVRACSW